MSSMKQASLKLQATAGKLKSLCVQCAIKLCERIKICQESTVLRSLFLSGRSRPTIALKLLTFNVCVDAVIREWIHWTITKEATSRVFSEAFRELVAFFVDNGLVGSRDPIWLQSAMDVLITLFEGIGLQTNPDKTKVMMCVSRNIRVAHMEVGYHAQQQGPVDPTMKRHWVECDVCTVSLATGSL
jgi:hypothetical protein